MKKDVYPQPQKFPHLSHLGGSPTPEVRSLPFYRFFCLGDKRAGLGEGPLSRTLKRCEVCNLAKPDREKRYIFFEMGPHPAVLRS